MSGFGSPSIDILTGCLLLVCCQHDRLPSAISQAASRSSSGRPTSSRISTGVITIKRRNICGVGQVRLLALCRVVPLVGTTDILCNSSAIVGRQLSSATNIGAERRRSPSATRHWNVVLAADSHHPPKPWPQRNVSPAADNGRPPCQVGRCRPVGGN